MADDYTPEADASYGLIYRLNYLWSKVDREALGGHYDQWELVLDTIFRNLLYREEVEAEEDDAGEIGEVTLSDKDSKIWKELKRNIVKVKIKRLKAFKTSNKIEFLESKKEHYESLTLYDIWLRKFMHHELKLYMKESSSNPSMSLFNRSLRRKNK